MFHCRVACQPLPSRRAKAQSPFPADPDEIAEQYVMGVSTHEKLPTSAFQN